MADSAGKKGPTGPEEGDPGALGLTLPEDPMLRDTDPEIDVAGTMGGVVAEVLEPAYVKERRLPSFEGGVPGYRDLLDVPIGNEEMKMKIAALLEFFDGERCVSHRKAEQALKGMFRELGEGTNLRLEAVLEKIPKWVLFTSVHGEYEPDEESIMGRLMDMLTRKIQADDPVLYENLGQLGAQTYLDLALKCPRMIDADENLEEWGIGGETRAGLAMEALRFQLLFSKKSHEVLKEESGHRLQYFLAEVATWLGSKAGEEMEIPPAEVKKFTPSLLLAGRLANIEEVRKFIDARLSLLLPDRAAGKSLISEGADGERVLLDMVQEDFVTCDLIAVSKKAGLYQEYQPIFEAILNYRQLQYSAACHFWEGKGRHMSTVRALKRWIAEHGGAKPKVLSVGCGNGFNLNGLIAADLVSQAVGVDKDDASLEDGFEELIEGRGGMTVVGAGKYDLSKPADSKALRKRVLAESGQAPDVILFADTLHETDDPYSYLLDGWDKLAPGGYMCVTDPIHSEHLDGVAERTLIPFDGTRHPSSVLSLEKYAKLILYMKFKGAEIVALKRMPAAYAGYNDHFWRLPFVLKKPEEIAVKPYEVPDYSREADGVEEFADVFEVFPLNLMRKDEKEALLAACSEFVGIFEDGRLASGELRKTLLIQLGAGEDAAKKAEPYKQVERLLEEVGVRVDSELTERNRKAGEVMAIVSLFKRVLNVDLGARLRKVPGWESYL